MKKMLAAVSATSLFMFAGAASAQSLVGSGVASGISFEVQQTTPTPVPCGFNLPFVTSSGNGYTTTGASPSAPSVLCNLGPGLNVFLTSDWTVEPIPGNYSKVLVKNITANALGGTCGPADVVADVVDPGADLILYVPWQSIAGSPLPCWIGGYVIVSGVALI